MTDRSPWRVDHNVREDAEQLFIPAEQLEGARPGDAVELHSETPPGVRTGTVVELQDDPERGRFVVVAVE